MNRFTATALAISISLLAAGAAQAADNFEPNNVPFQGVYGQDEGGPSRAQVKAELAQAKSQGLVATTESGTGFKGVYASNESGKTRAQVVAELADAKAHGAVFNIEPNDVPFQGVYGQAAPSQLALGQ